MAAGSVVITEKKYPSVQLITFAWTCDASGNVNGLAATLGRYTGQALQLATVPGSGLSAYTIAILDSNSIDILCGKGTARSTTVPDYLLAPTVAGSLGAISDDVLTITISGAGNAKTGTAYLWIR